MNGDRSNLCKVLASAVAASSDITNQLTAVYEYGLSQGVTYDDYASAQLVNSEINTSKSERQFQYLNCSQFGFSLTPNIEYPMRSTLLTTQFFEQYC